MKQTIGSVETAASCGCGTASDPPGALVTSLKIRRRKVWANTGNVQRDPFCVGPVGAGSCGVCGDEPRPPAARLATAVKFRRNVVQPSWPIIADAPVCGDPTPCCSGTLLAPSCESLGELPQRLWLTILHQYATDRRRAWSEPIQYAPESPIPLSGSNGWYGRWLGSVTRDTSAPAGVCRYLLDAAGLRLPASDNPPVPLASLPFANLAQYGALVTADPVFTDAELDAWNRPEEFADTAGMDVYAVAVAAGDPPPTDYTLGALAFTVRRGVASPSFVGGGSVLGRGVSLSVAQVGGNLTATVMQTPPLTPTTPFDPFAAVDVIDETPWIGRFRLGVITGNDVYLFLVADDAATSTPFAEPPAWRVEVITGGLLQSTPLVNTSSLAYNYQIIPAIAPGNPTGAIGYLPPGSCDFRSPRLSISSTELRRWTGGVLTYSVAPDWFDPATTTAKFTLPESPPIEILAYGYD
jgi:hypothetical protein